MSIISLLSGSLALEALLIGVHCKKRYINVYIQYNTIQLYYVYFPCNICVVCMRFRGPAVSSLQERPAVDSSSYTRIVVSELNDALTVDAESACIHTSLCKLNGAMSLPFRGPIESVFIFCTATSIPNASVIYAGSLYVAP